MKLIPMTDFVLEQSKKIMNCELTHLESHHQIVGYANFLKQPLKLEMFEGIEKLFSNTEIIDDEGQTWVFYGGKYRFLTSMIIGKTIEDLSWSSLELTPNAIKQLSL